MMLESAREVKASLLQGTLKSLLKQPKKLQAYGVAAVRVEDVPKHIPTIALGISSANQKDYRLAVRVQERAYEHGPHLDAIRKASKNEVDVQFVGWIEAQATAAPWHQGRQRPVLAGCSVGHFRITAGTLGCFVKRKGQSARCILSNNHVLADVNGGKSGDAIRQPGNADDGSAKDEVADLDVFVKLRDGANTVDAAIARLRDGVGPADGDVAQLKGVGKISGVRHELPDIGELVAKLGRTTGVTRGRVTAFDLDNLAVGFGPATTFVFNNQIEIEGADDAPFSRGGDSGSLIVDADVKALALLFAGGDSGGSNEKGLTFAHPIEAVLSALKIEILY